MDQTVVFKSVRAFCFAPDHFRQLDELFCVAVELRRKFDDVSARGVAATGLFQVDVEFERFAVEAFDRAEAKAMLVSGVLEHFPEKYLVAGSGLAGLGSANTIQTRRVSQRFYLCGDGTSDSSVGLGLVASRVLVCAAHEANMILRLIAGETEP